MDSTLKQLSINLQWQAFIRHCAQHANNGIVAKLDCGIDVCWTQSTLPFLNGFFLSTAVANELDLCHRLEQIKEFTKKMQPSFSWALFIEPEWLSFGVREQSKEICLSSEFVPAPDVKCMQTTRLVPSVRPLPVVDIKFATSQHDVHDALVLNVEAYNMDLSVAHNVLENRAFISDYDKQICCIVSVDNKPVATATTVLLEECLYVALVATSAQHRKVSFHTDSINL